MAESDYQRGLRGGNCRISKNPQAWDDCEEGYRNREQNLQNAQRAREAEQDDRDEASYLSVLTPIEKIAYFDKNKRKKGKGGKRGICSKPSSTTGTV